jgi:hypothetical protein
MKKGSLLVVAFALTAGVTAFAQHGRGGGMGNAGGRGVGSMGNPGSVERGSDASAGRQVGSPHGNTRTQTGDMSSQQTLKPSQINGGAFRMLERKYPDLTSSQLQDLYRTSGAKNFGQFVSAMVVSKNLGLDYNKVLTGMQTQSLGKTLQSMGVNKDKAKQAINQAHEEIRNTRNPADSGGNS